MVLKVNNVSAARPTTKKTTTTQTQRTAKPKTKTASKEALGRISQKQQELDYINAVLRERNLNDDVSKVIHKFSDWVLNKINPDNQTTDSALQKRRAILKKEIRAAGFKA